MNFVYTALAIVAASLVLVVLSERFGRIEHMLRTINRKVGRTMLNTTALQTAVGDIQREVTENGAKVQEAIDILNGSGDAQTRIDQATAALAGAATSLNDTEGALAAAIDAANPTTPGGVNDGENGGGDIPETPEEPTPPSETPAEEPAAPNDGEFS